MNNVNLVALTILTMNLKHVLLASPQQCKMKSIVIVFDSTHLMSKELFHFIQLQLSYPFFESLQAYTGFTSDVSCLVYTNNDDCNPNVHTLGSDRYFRSINKGASELKEHFSKLKHVESHSHYDFQCARKLLFTQYNCFSPKTDIIGILLYRQAIGIYIDVYLGRSLIFHGKVMHRDHAAVIDSTKLVQQVPFDRKLEELSNRVWVDGQLSGDIQSAVWSGAVYFKNDECSIRDSPGDYFPPTVGFHNIDISIKQLRYAKVQERFSMDCAEKLLFEQYEKFQHGENGVTGYIYYNKDINTAVSTMYYNKHKVYSHTHSIYLTAASHINFHSEFIKLVCNSIDGSPTVQPSTKAPLTLSTKSTPKSSTTTPKPIPIDDAVDRISNLIKKETPKQIYDKREEISDIVNNVLTQETTTIQKDVESATKMLHVMFNFSKDLGKYLDSSKNRNVNIQKSKVAIDVSIREARDVSMLVEFDKSDNLVKVKTMQNYYFDEPNEENSYRGSISVPKSALNKSSNTLYTSVYKDAKLFTDTNKKIIASFVFSISVNEQKHTTLSSPVKLSFKKTRNHKDWKFSCVYWVFPSVEGSYGHWDSKGCKKVNETNSTITCMCNHMTNFALLMDVSQEHLDNIYLTVITWFGCSLSIVSLVITIAAYAYIKKVNRLLQSKIYVRLSASLCCLLVVFLAFSDNRSGNQGSLLCQISSAFIHYLLLVTFMWKGTGALSMYKMFAKPMESFNQSKFLIQMTIINFIVPAIIVIASAAAGPAYLTTTKACFPRSVSFYVSVLSPVAIILLFNMAIVGVVIRAIFQPNIASQKKTTTQKQCRITIFISVLLGGTWLIAMFGFGAASMAVQVVFSLITSLQGLFISFMFVVYPREMRPLAWQMICDAVNRISCCKGLRNRANTLSQSFSKKSISLTTVVSTSSQDQVEDLNERSKPRPTPTAPPATISKSATPQPWPAPPVKAVTDF